MRFLDCFRFLPDRLEKLSKSLQEEDFKIIQNHFPKQDQKKLLMRKEV